MAAQHRYSVGDNVYFLSAPNHGYQYWVRSALESFDRIAAESELGVNRPHPNTRTTRRFVTIPKPFRLKGMEQERPAMPCKFLPPRPTNIGRPQITLWSRAFLKRFRAPDALTAAVMAACMFANPAAASTFEKCVAGIRADVLKAGIKPDVVNAAFRNIKFDEKAVRFSRTQPEYRLAIWDYMATLVDDVRITDGLKMMKVHQQILRDVEKIYGVDRFILTALWGVESDYGKEMGEFFLPHALSNVVCAGRKAAVFKTELIHALRIVAAGNVKLENLRGSWAGAFGQTQFIPSTYRRLAVDFDGDGRRDTIHSIPDTLASAANFLKKAGWQPGVKWGFEVNVPRSYAGPVGRAKTSPISQWAKRGISRADGSPMPTKGSYALIRPAGHKGPAFLVSRNFDVLYSYNAAEAYALAISHLSDRLDGEGGFKTAWPTDDPGLTRAQRKRLQQLLIEQGYYKGEADGRVGPLTMAAIKEAETKIGLKPTGRPGTRILNALSGNSSPQ